MATRANPNTFANNPLDRAAERRLDPMWLKDRLKDPATLIVPFYDAQPFIVPGPTEGEGAEVGFLRPGLFGDGAAEPVTIFLGVEKDVAYFAVDLSEGPDPSRSGVLEGLGSFEELRMVAGDLPPGDAAILAQAKSLIDWHARHRYCANCGTETVLEDAGYKRQCHDCDASHFPRTDPVVITLATKGDRCLMGRGPQWPRKFYSALAGYVEPGETIEEAAAREVFEETRIKVRDVRIHSNQPWPYPSSLMIGCFAEAETMEITVDGIEIAEADWFTRDELAEALRGDTSRLKVPPPMAIAHQLIRAFITDR